VGSGPTPPPKPLAQAIHDALGGAGGEQIQGVSANVTLTDHLLEGASLAGGGGGGGGGGGELTSSPLIAGGSGRLWLAKDGDVRLELQSQQGDTQVIYNGHTLTVYDAASNTVYRYTPPAHEGGSGAGAPDGSDHEVPSVAKIEEAIAHLSKHADVSGATPSDVAGHAAYTVRVSPNEAGSLFGGVELSFDAGNGVPLRAAVYSSTSAAPVIELAATEISYGPVSGSVFEINPPANAKVEEISTPSSSGDHPAHKGDKPTITTHGHGPSTIAVVATKTNKKDAQGDGGESLASSRYGEGLPKVTIDGVSASELRTELGTLLSFERDGVRYLVAGSVTPAAVEEVARGL
jgi:outer membrane lipoprotein-sorting protein